MNKKLTEIMNLADYLNHSTFTTLDDEIAQYLYEHRDEIKHKSLTNFSKESYYSQASFSRFLHKHGLNSYQDFKITMVESNILSKQTFNYIINKNKALSYEEINDNMIQRIQSLNDPFKEMSYENYIETVDMLRRYKRVIFIGSEILVNSLNILQNFMITTGQHVYCLSNLNGQENFLSKTTQDDLIIVLSTNGKWYNAEYSKSTIKTLHQSKAYKSLWTMNKKHTDKDLFNHILLYGDQSKGLGYIQFNYLVIFLVEFYSKEIE